MYNADPNIPTAVASSDDDGLQAGLNWAIKHYQDDEDAEGITVWTHGVQQKSANPILEQFIDRNREVHHVTGRGPDSPRVRGPLIVAWGDTVDIPRAIGYAWAQVTALVVIEWATEDLYPWVKFSDAELLGDTSIWPDDNPTIVPVVLRVMESMTRVLNHNNTIKAGFEKDHSVGPLVLLKKAGYQLDSRVLRGWAAANGWRRDNVKHLGDYIDQINKGGRPRYDQSAIRSNYVKILEAEVRSEN